MEHNGVQEEALVDIHGKVESCIAKVEALRLAQGKAVEKQIEADEVHRNQLDCVSERVFKAELELRQARQQQEDAIDKANAAFQAHSFEVQQDRQNFSNTISAVTQQFEQISRQVMSDGVSLGMFRQDVLALQHTAQEHQRLIGEAHMVALANREAMTHLTPCLDFAECDRQHKALATEFFKLHDLVMCLNGQMAEVQCDLRLLERRLTDSCVEGKTPCQQQFYGSIGKPRSVSKADGPVAGSFPQPDELLRPGPNAEKGLGSSPWEVDAAHWPEDFVPGSPPYSEPSRAREHGGQLAQCSDTFIMASDGCPDQPTCAPPCAISATEDIYLSGDNRQAGQAPQSEGVLGAGEENERTGDKLSASERERNGGQWSNIEDADGPSLGVTGASGAAVVEEKGFTCAAFVAPRGAVGTPHGQQPPAQPEDPSLAVEAFATEPAKWEESDRAVAATEVVEVAAAVVEMELGAVLAGLTNDCHGGGDPGGIGGSLSLGAALIEDDTNDTAPGQGSPQMELAPFDAASVDAADAGDDALLSDGSPEADGCVSESLLGRSDAENSNGELVAEASDVCVAEPLPAQPAPSLQGASSRVVGRCKVMKGRGRGRGRAAGSVCREEGSAESAI